MARSVLKQTEEIYEYVDSLWCGVSLSVIDIYDWSKVIWHMKSWLGVGEVVREWDEVTSYGLLA